ncbi:hypothetical protein HDZ31DRAFT_51536, partial [Schizophyllum fasciatum]
LVSELANRPDAVIFAGARDPTRASDLQALQAQHPDRVHIVKVISADRASNAAAVDEIKRVAGRLDVVIANAGIGDCFKGALQIPPEELVRHLQVNTNGPLVLFQETYALLRESPNPKFVAVSSLLGSISTGTALPMNTYAYGASKAALNWVLVKLHHDFPGLTVFPINPGVADTDMAHLSLDNDPDRHKLSGDYPLITPQESARGILEQVDAATRETHGGKFADYTGPEKWQW